MRPSLNAHPYFSEGGDELFFESNLAKVACSPVPKEGDASRRCANSNNQIDADSKSDSLTSVSSTVLNMRFSEKAFGASLPIFSIYSAFPCAVVLIKSPEALILGIREPD
jgi:hypothetical protein